MLVQVHGRDFPLLWEQDPNNPEPIILAPTAPVRHDNVRETDSDDENYNPHDLVQIHGRDFPLLWEQDPNISEPIILAPAAPVPHDNVRETDSDDENYNPHDLVQIHGRDFPLLWEQDPNISEPIILAPAAPVPHDNVRETDSDDENYNPHDLVQIQSPKNPKPQPPTAPVSNVNSGRFQEDAQMVNQQSVQGDTNHIAMVYSPVTALHDQLPLQESEAQPQVVGVNPDLGMELGGVIVLDDVNVQDVVLVTTVQTTPAIMEEV
ncbi:Hypothetical predicted protein [Paramuricea clavata]|uniref:Uncharacterized protein n=1 Tax=Paramuricea clavata TaxID=317549 RepID=A0A6S7IWV2_PARCT|nr:Hypothetical predicted protein [Paramuricea clavata]